ncbi:MAG: hypothetical protein K8R87_03860 [Verrucomicrobia bacterium]|nr:hypothetical protein [Verrucomicrobiota bacterium]
METQWYLLKVSDNEIFGPAPLSQLRIWAAEAKISPMDRVSSDNRKSWQRAPMVTELQMDWLVEMPDGFLYGPTSVGTLQEFLATGEIDERTTVINTFENTKTRINELAFFMASPQRVRGSQEIAPNIGDNADATPGDSQRLQERCAWLERQNMDLQREIGRWHDTVQSLRQQFIEATGAEPN